MAEAGRKTGSKTVAKAESTTPAKSANGASPSPAAKGSGGTNNAVSTPLRTSKHDQIYETAYGARVRFGVTNPRATYEGTIFAACPKTSLLAIIISSQTPTGNMTSISSNYTLVSIPSITNYTILSTPSAPPNPPALLPTPNHAALLARANTALERAKTNAAKQNKLVDRKTQDLFDALDKQFNARWKAKDIIVMDRVVVKGPLHRPEDCKVITEDGEGLLARVRKVLENEKRRAIQRDAAAAVKSAAGTASVDISDGPPSVGPQTRGRPTASGGNSNGPAAPPFRAAIVPAIPVSTGGRKGG